MSIKFDDLKVGMVLRNSSYVLFYVCEVLQDYCTVILYKQNNNKYMIARQDFDKECYEEDIPYAQSSPRKWLRMCDIIEYAHDLEMRKLDTNQDSVVEKQDFIQNDYDFFSSVADGNCKCGIPKHTCDYHR